MKQNKKYIKKISNKKGNCLFFQIYISECGKYNCGTSVDIGYLTINVGFKFFFKDDSTRYYVAGIIADILHMEYDYVIKNMKYLDVELVILKG